MPKIGQKKAEQIATNFLQQHYSAATVESAFFENEVWVISLNVGLINKQIRRVLVDADSGRILGFSDSTSNNNDHAIKKALVMLAVEKTLVEIGQPAYKKVVSKLYEDYNYYLPDCYEYPEYLNKVLKEVFGDSYTVIVESIRARLKEFADQKYVANFLNVISR